MGLGCLGVIGELGVSQEVRSIGILCFWKMERYEKRNEILGVISL